MSKITFRADDDLVEAVEALDASKSEIMREALRAYLGVDEPGNPGRIGHHPIEESLEDVIARRVDDRLDERLAGRASDDRDLTIRVEVGGREDVHVGHADARVDSESASDASATRRTGAPTHSCPQCGTDLAASYAYCPNCGDRTTPSVYCECGRELDAAWAFCPDCGRRTATPDFPEL